MATKYQVVVRHNGSETRLPQLWDFMSLAEASAAEWEFRAAFCGVVGEIKTEVVAVEAQDEGRA